MNPPSDEPPPSRSAEVDHVFSVRDRPVGFRTLHWGAELVAMERGYFPVSSTGYYSLCGFAGGKPFDASALSGEFLESLAVEQDRERRVLLLRLRQALRPESDAHRNFIHASLAAEKALHDGFFARDEDRRILWQAAHRLLCFIDTDRRYQPIPNGAVWDVGHCNRALERLGALHALLRCWARGEIAGEVPMTSDAPISYWKLAVRTEPLVALDNAAIALVLDDWLQTAPAKAPAVSNRKATEALDDSQLGLFEAASIARSYPSSRQSLGPRISQ